MTVNTPSAPTLKVRPGPAGQCDLVVQSGARGVGRLALDATLLSPLLIALGTDRRAETDDVLPLALTAPQGAAEPLGARRGWVGDVLLSNGERLGSRTWLLERAKRTPETARRAERYASEACQPIADYHGMEVTAQAAWAGRGVLRVGVQAGGVSLVQTVPVS
ncbi:hypothetical protein E3E12_05980 [Formicincola oecophyllae]|uniref:Uncharacterized protein n=1 Tax=Formicincola oecophyllae TaxID=2558361 RepID=A0A4Y6U9C3_9PROT|nr:phage GP46 family protein [Formicincola oecophyllae]QDH13804.1 hypothetical protein E3E12_05980 [Formicincola oecophyllae]